MIATTLTSVARLIVEALALRGIDGNQMLRAAGLEPARLGDPNARYPFTGMTRLWNLAVEETGEECFGLEVSRLMHPTSLHAIGFAWLASDSLADALGRFERYCRVASTAIAATLERRRGVYALAIEPAPASAAFAPAASDAAAATLILLCRLSAGEDFRPLRIRLPRRAPARTCREEMAQQLRAPIDFNAERLELEIDAQIAERTLPSGNAELAHANERVLIDYLAHLDRSHLGDRVKARLVDALPAGQISEEAIATSLNVSTRSLQRRLREEQTSYKQLLDDTRRELAAQYLGDSKLSIGEVTYLLGFSDPSNFTRAFRRWQGVSPSRFRRDMFAA